ncbi:MAG: membrane protein insertase YidC [Terriglobales bacterium]
MERRLLLVFGLTFLLLLLLQPLLMKYLKKPGAAEPQPQATVPAEGIPAGTVSAPTVGTANESATPAAGVKQATGESEVVVENDLYRITFTNKGAQVKSWVLKKFDDDQGRPLELINSSARVEAQQNGQPVMQPASEKYGLPMSLWTYDEGLRTRLNAGLYVAGSTGELKTPADLQFEYSDGDLEVHKSFHFDESYLVKVETEVTSSGKPVQAYTAWPAGFGDQIVPASYAAAQVVYQSGDKVTRIKKVSGGSTLQGPFNWAGAVDQYFGAVFLPDQPNSATLVTLSSAAAIPKNLDKPDWKETVPVNLIGFAIGNVNGPTSGRWFIGPKTVNVIDNIWSRPVSGQAVGPNLGGVVDFGFFGMVGKPLFLWLKWTQSKLSSNPREGWGWAIAILTIVINLALLPLRITSMKSALKMQKIQPQVEEIKNRYKNVPMNEKAEMNQEIGKLFKENGVNPAGGCLPMILQLPFLWAFYTMLSATIELRHASWLWVKDLSSPDPLHLLPILIVLSTFGMQRMTPTPGMDPGQARMMNLMMPAMLGVFSWSVAAGLGEYWLLGTLIAIATQVALNRTAMGQEMRAVAEKRARRKEARKGK